MTPLQQKVNIVQQYILAKKSINIKITFKNGDNTRELLMLDQAFEYATKFFKRQTQFYG